MTENTQLEDLRERAEENVGKFQEELKTAELPKSEKEFMAIARTKELMDSDFKRRHEEIEKISPAADVLLERALERGIKSSNVQDVPDETIDKLFAPEEGEAIELSIEFNTEKRKQEFKRSFLAMVLINKEADDVYTTETARLNEEIAKDMEEFQKTVAQYGDFNNYIRSELEYNVKNASLPEERERQKELLKYLDYAETSENILTAIKKGDKDNFLSDYRNESKQVDVYTRYLKIVKKMGNNVDLTKFGNIEERIPGYEQYLNMFVFAVMRAIAYEKDASQNQGFYLANLGMILQEFLAGTLSKEREERFVNGVKAVIDYYTK